MRVERIEAHAGPEPGRCRLEATVIYADSSSETLWFNYPESCLPELNQTGDPWLTLLAPLAMTLGEPLQLPFPVDAGLLRGVHQVAEVWRSWKPGLPALEVDAPFEVRQPAASARRTMSFFSGGVDSWYTALVNPAEAAAGKMPRIDTLLVVWGADVRLQEVQALEAVKAAVERAASYLGHDCMMVSTNIRETRWSRTDWARESHGAFFMALVHGAGRFRHALVPSSVSYTFGPWGSHPLTDPLLSSAATQVIYHAADQYRFGKIGVISRNQAALDQLRVCWRSGTDQNCGHCGKCLRTMIGLELFGALERCPSFPVRSLDPDLAARLLVDTPLRIVQLHQMREFAIRHGRADMDQALKRAWKRSRRVTLIGPLLGRLDRAGMRGAHRLRSWLERDLVRE